MQQEIKLPKLPKSWDELSAEQMVHINGLRRSHGASMGEFFYTVISYLLSLQCTGEFYLAQDGTTYRGFNRFVDEVPQFSEPFYLSGEDFFQMGEAHLKWLLQDSTRLQDVFPKLTLDGVEFTSPGYAMAGMTYQQFQFTQRYMAAYHQATSRLFNVVRNRPDITEAEVKPMLEQREDLRCRLMACIFTPAIKVASKTVDGKQVVFDPPIVDYVFATSQIEQHAPRFREWSEDKSDAVIQHFTGVMLHYKKLYPLLFKEGEGGESDMIKAEEGTLNALQDKLRFANYQTIYDSNAPFILGKLHSIIKEAKDIESAHLRMKARSH